MYALGKQGYRMHWIYTLIVKTLWFFQRQAQIVEAVVTSNAVLH